MPFRLALAALVAAPLLLGACAREATPDDGRVRVVATTSIVADLVRQVGGEHVAVEALMGPNVDPHLYRPSEGDVARMAGADAVFTIGLDLEGKMGEALEGLAGRGIRVAAVAEAVPPASLRASEQYAGAFDPHVWMDPTLWAYAAEAAAQDLTALAPEHAAAFAERLAAVQDSLDALDAEIADALSAIPDDRRVLVTAHDAFAYYGARYGIAVRGLQGLSTATEAGTADVQDLARFVAERRIPTLFVETSVSERTIRAVQEAVEARGFTVALGEPLYSDALGAEGSGADTHAGMLRHNTRAIVAGLAPGSDA